MNAVISFEHDVAELLDENKSTKKPKSSTKKRISALIKLWHKYVTCIQKDQLSLKLLKLGEILMDAKEHGMAAKCFGLYLQETHLFRHEKVVDEDYVKAFFKTKSFDESLIKAFLNFGSCMASYYHEDDPSFQFSTSQVKIKQMLNLLQLTSEKAITKNGYSWLVYNCTIHIYNICLKLMTERLSIIAVDYLIWCCVCMESSIPLMTVKYLKWRSQLYVATSECYYTLNSGVCGEEFARRGLQKVIELEEIEKMSLSTSCPERLQIFKESFFKLKVAIFKRDVIESRRYAKSLKPKLKLALSDIVHNKWPRTVCEQLLVESFNGRSAQFFAVIETLANKKLEIIKRKNIQHEGENVEEVISELFFAGVELATFTGHDKSTGQEINRVNVSVSLTTLAIAESDSITLCSLTKFLILTFMHEKWDIFDNLVDQVLNELNKQNDNIDILLDQEILRILSAFSIMHPSYHVRKSSGLKTKKQKSVRDTRKIPVKDLLNISKLLNDFVTNIISSTFILKYHHMLVDIILFIWSAFKPHFVNEIADGHIQSLLQETNFSLIFEVVVKIQHVMVAVGIQNISLVCFMEATLTTSIFVEQFIEKAQFGENIPFSISPEIMKQAASVLNIKMDTLCFLHFVDNLLLSALKVIQTAKNSMKINVRDALNEEEKKNARNVGALHLELMFKQHCIATLIDYFTPKEVIKSVSLVKKPVLKKVQVKLKTKCSIANNGCENDLSKALFIISNVLVRNEEFKNDEANKMLKEASQLLQRELHITKKPSLNADIINGPLIPPAPLLLHQGLNCVILKPAPFSAAGNTVAYYSIYLSLAASKRVTPDDISFEGTGDLVQNSSDCLFVIKGLVPNTAYIAAVAAFNEKLTLVGSSIGVACNPFYTVDSLSPIQAFSYLSQVAYKCQVYKVAKNAAETVWNFFVYQDSDIASLSSKQSRLKRLNLSTFNSSSTVLQRLFVQTVFIYADVIIKEEQLYWYMFTMKRQLANNQMQRINLCSKIVLGIQASALLNDESLCIQGCVQIYELLSPIIYWKLIIFPALQIIEYLFAIFQEIKNVPKYTSLTSDTLQLMVICLTNYSAKILMWLKCESSAVDALQLGKSICSGLSNILSNDNSFVSEASANKIKLHQKVRKRLSVGRGLKEFHTREIKLHTIELLSLRLSEQEKDLLFNGGEDSIIFKIDLDSMASLEALNEVIKFKRRTDFLENFVGVISKVLNERSFENVIIWTEKTLNLLRKRNLKFLTANEDELFVEQTDELQETDNGDGKKEICPQKKEKRYKQYQATKLRNVIKRSDLYKRNKPSTNHKNEQIFTVKLNFKTAFKSILPKILQFLKVKQQRMKFKAFSRIELPWRCQLYLINGECHFQLALEKFKNMAIQGSGKNIISHPINQLENKCDSERVIDSNMFTFGSLGVLLVNWLGSMNGPIIQTDNTQICALEDPFDHDLSSLSPATKMPKFFDKKFVEHFKAACLFLKRAMILAHRGKHWMLLQQACNNLLVYTQTFVFKTIDVNITLDNRNRYCINHLRSMVYMDFYWAADFILDMMSINFKNKVQPKCFSNCLIENYGISYADMIHVVFFAIEVLFHEKEFDKVCNLILRLNQLTQEFYCEELLPLLSYSKQYLNDQDGNYGVPKTFSTSIPIVESIPKTNETNHCYNEETKNSALLHEFLHKPERNVASETKEVLKKFYCCLETKSKVMRLLKHSRTLLYRYLAGKIGVKDLSINPKPFLKEINLLENSFTSIDDVEVQPLVLDSDLEIVIASYENTIDHLLRQQSEHAASAMNELGNVFFHLKDKRNAKIWWSKAIDSIVKKSEGLKSWRELVLSDERSILTYKKLLEKCDIWGCLLVSVLAAKIARYICDGDVNECIDACQMSAAFIKATFCCSLDHPLICAAYATYQIGKKYPTKHILPGINLFADNHHVNSVSLLANTVWVSKQLLIVGYYLEIQPLLTFSQYLSDQIDNLLSAVEVKLMRVYSLIQMSLLNLAINNFIDIMSGLNLPAPADVIVRNVLYKWPIVHDNVLTSHEFLNLLCQFKVTSHHLVVYGSLLCYKVSVQQAVLISAVASLIYEYPKVEKSDLNDKMCSFQESKKKELTENNESSLNPSFNCLLMNSAQLRGKLLGRSKQILIDVLTNSSEDCVLTSSQQLEFFVSCHLEIASISEQQLMLTRSIDHIYLCLQAFDTFDGRLKENGKYSSDVPKFPDFSVNIWMLCKTRLCNLLDQRSIFQPNHILVNETNVNLSQAVLDCKTFNDSFSLFSFELLKLKIDMHKGLSASEVLSKLEEMQNLILALHEIPLTIKCLLFEVQTMRADLHALISLDASIKFYLLLENSILNEMMFHGLQVDSFKYPSLDKNSKLFAIYLAVKFRSISLQVKFADSCNHAHKIEMLSNLLNEISACLSTYCLLMINEVTMATEMKLLKGKLQRLLFELGCLDMMSCISTFLDIINTTCTLTGDLNVSQQCCCEIALALFYKIENNTDNKPLGHIFHYLTWLCIHTASVISDFEKNAASYSDEDSVITNHDDFPEFLWEDLGEKIVSIKNVLQYIAQLHSQSTLYSSSTTICERKRCIPYPKGYFNPVYKLRAIHAYFFASPHYNVSIFAALKYISNKKIIESSVICDGSISSSVICDGSIVPSVIFDGNISSSVICDLDACFDNLLFSDVNEVAICWYASDVLPGNGFLHFLMALSKRKIDGSVLKEILQGETSSCIVVSSAYVATNALVILHQQLVKSMVLVGIFYDDSSSTTGLVQHLRTKDENDKELENFRTEFEQILSTFRSVVNTFRSKLHKNENTSLLLNQKNVCDLEKILSVNRNQIIMASSSLAAWL